MVTASELNSQCRQGRMQAFLSLHTACVSHCCLQDTSGDGSTPSLLDARAASPSAVYNSLYTTTPFRGALAALPIDAALNAPLVDSSPFDITVRLVGVSLGRQQSYMPQDAGAQ